MAVALPQRAIVALLGTIMFGKRELRPGLLAVRANQGCRYVVARMDDTGEPWFVSIEPGGFMSGHPVDGEFMGQSTAPFETWVAAGVLPRGARKVEIDAGGVVPGKVRAGLWLAGIPWNNRDMQIEVRFRAADGSVLSRLEEELIHFRPM